MSFVWRHLNLAPASRCFSPRVYTVNNGHSPKPRHRHTPDARRERPCPFAQPRRRRRTRLFPLLRCGKRRHPGDSTCKDAPDELLPIFAAASARWARLSVRFRTNERIFRGLREMPCPRIFQASADASSRRMLTNGKALPRAGLSSESQEHATHKKPRRLGRGFQFSSLTRWATRRPCRRP